MLYAASPEIAAYLMTPFILLGFGAYHIFLHAAFWLMFVLLWLNQNYYAFQKFLDENPVARQLFEDNLADALDILKTLFEDLFDQQQPSPEPDPSKDSGVCFIAGTKVLIPEGFVAIENLTVGGEVLARDLSRGETIAAKIICTFRNLATELVVIKVLGETIRCTKSHPFWTINRGWARAKNLTVSDILQDSHGNPVPILDIEHKGLLSPVEVYNIEVEDFHNYHVGIAGILSHNRC